MKDVCKLDLQRLKRICEIASGIDGNAGREALMALQELTAFMNQMDAMIACDCLGPFSVGGGTMEMLKGVEYESSS